VGSAQGKLPRRPSLTAATTRAERAKARAWARERKLPTYAGLICTDYDVRGNRKHADGGVLIMLGSDQRPMCWDCLPYPGSPVRNWEHWSTTEEDRGERCIRCLRSMSGRGGVHGRGGPFCWECGSPTDSEMEAFILAAREDRALVPPWAGDKVVRP